MTEKFREKLNTAQWVFERTLGWIAAAEIKVAAICAIDTAMLGGLGALFVTEWKKSAWANLFGIMALLCLFSGIICAALVLIPRLHGGPSQSLLYFGKVADLSSCTYEKMLLDVSDEQLLSDWAAQIHFNARVAQKKHEWVRKCLYWSILGAFPWLGAIFAILASR